MLLGGYIDNKIIEVFRQTEFVRKDRQYDCMHGGHDVAPSKHWSKINYGKYISKVYMTSSFAQADPYVCKSFPCLNRFEELCTSLSQIIYRSSMC